MTHSLSGVQKDYAVAFFKDVQNRLLTHFEEVDGIARAERKPWERAQGGGGIMGVIRGEVVDKAGANFSAVNGDAYPALEEKYKGQPFFASGISTITHMMNPNAPIGHMNVRLLAVGDTFWLGGGADLTPFVKFQEDTDEFHAALRSACNQFGSELYEKYSKWCDEYFYIPHRQSIRGVGGIFFDHLQGDFEKLFPLVEATANAYVEVFPKILQRRKDMVYTMEEKDGQLYWRGRYAEFNLAWDRGTKFGLMTNGNIEAIFVSLPPVVKW